MNGAERRELSPAVTVQLRFHGLGDHERVWLGLRRQASGYVDSVPEQVVTVDDNFAEMRASTYARQSAVRLAGATDQYCGGAHSIAGERKIHHETIASGAEDPAAMVARNVANL